MNVRVLNRGSVRCVLHDWRNLARAQATLLEAQSLLLDDSATPSWLEPCHAFQPKNRTWYYTLHFLRGSQGPNSHSRREECSRILNWPSPCMVQDS